MKTYPIDVITDATPDIQKEHHLLYKIKDPKIKQLAYGIASLVEQGINSGRDKSDGQIIMLLNEFRDYIDQQVERAVKDEYRTYFGDNK